MDLNHKITEFKLVEVTILELFNDDVNKLIKEGYQPLGNFQFVPGNKCHPDIYLQVMVKYQF